MASSEICITPGISPEEVEDRVHRFVHDRMKDDEEIIFSEHICVCQHCADLVDEAILLKDSVTLADAYKRLDEGIDKKDWRTSAEAAKEMLAVGFDDNIWHAKEMIETAIREHKILEATSQPKLREGKIFRLRALKNQGKSKKKKSGEDD